MANFGKKIINIKGNFIKGVRNNDCIRNINVYMHAPNCTLRSQSADDRSEMVQSN